MAMRTAGYVVLTMAACLALANCKPADAPAGQTAPPTALSAAPAADPAPAEASSKPQHVGDCIETTVTSVGSRLEGVPDSGSAIIYDNGMAQVDYGAIDGIDHSKSGDQVRLCLTTIPQGCPPGDDRGRVYSATNARTGETWSAMDSEHSCGGA